MWLEWWMITWRTQFNKSFIDPSFLFFSTTHPFWVSSYIKLNNCLLPFWSKEKLVHHKINQSRLALSITHTLYTEGSLPLSLSRPPPFHSYISLDSPHLRINQVQKNRVIGINTIKLDTKTTQHGWELISILILVYLPIFTLHITSLSLSLHLHKQKIYLTL